MQPSGGKTVLTLRQKIDVMRILETSLEKVGSGVLFKGGATDISIAKQLGVLPQSVARIRRQQFGNLTSEAPTVLTKSNMAVDIDRRLAHIQLCVDAIMRCVGVKLDEESA